MPENTDRETIEWLRVRYEKLITDAMELLAKVPNQYCADPGEELLSRLKYLRDNQDVDY